MKITSIKEIDFNETLLLNYLYDKFKSESVDEVLDYLTTEEGMKLISSFASESCIDLDDNSYEKIFSYVRNNF